MIFTEEQVLTADRVESLLETGMAVELEAAGVSMKPLIFPGWKLLVESAVADSLREGQVVLARVGPNLRAHRLVKILDDENPCKRRIILKGDNAPREEGPFPMQSVKGRVRRIVCPWFGFDPGHFWARLAYVPLRWGYRLCRFLSSGPEEFETF